MENYIILDEPNYKVAGSEYPCGPCGLPLICGHCEFLITQDNVIEIPGDNEIAEYCGDEACHNCKTYWHCGGCV